MNENIKKFLEKAAQAPELLAKMSVIQDPDEAYRLASSVQDGFTKEEFITAMKEFAAVNGDLTADDLKKFAGGGTSELVSMSISASVSAGTGAAAVAGAAI